MDLKEGSPDPTTAGWNDSRCSRLRKLIEPQARQRAEQQNERLEQRKGRVEHEYKVRKPAQHEFEPDEASDEGSDEVSSEASCDASSEAAEKAPEEADRSCSARFVAI